WARFKLPVDARIEQALRDGVTLYYVVEFDLTRPRWWWWDEQTVEARRVHALSFHLLTQRFRANIGGEVRDFATLAEAAQAVAQVTGWNVVPVEELGPNTHYDARLRLRFDRDRLPKPYQLGALTNNDWDIGSEWKGFTLTTATPASARQDGRSGLRCSSRSHSRSSCWPCSPPPPPTRPCSSATTSCCSGSPWAWRWCSCCSCWSSRAGSSNATDAACSAPG